MTADPEGAEGCLNCGAALQGSFCAGCGQKTVRRRLATLPLMAGAWESLVSLDTRFLRTVIGLTLRPGAVSRDYVAGRRTHYFHPVQYALLTSAFWWFCVIQVNDPVALAELGVAKTSGQLLNLVMIPFLAVGLWGVFRGAGRSYAETLVFTLYTFSQVFAWRGLLAIAGGAGASEVGLYWADTVLFMAYATWSLVQFYRGTVRWLAVRVVLGILSILVVSGLGVAVFQGIVGGGPKPSPEVESVEDAAASGGAAAGPSDGD